MLARYHSAFVCLRGWVGGGVLVWFCTVGVRIRTTCTAGKVDFLFQLYSSPWLLCFMYCLSVRVHAFLVLFVLGQHQNWHRDALTTMFVGGVGAQWPR